MWGIFYRAEVLVRGFSDFICRSMWCRTHLRFLLFLSKLSSFSIFSSLFCCSWSDFKWWSRCWFKLWLLSFGGNNFLDWWFLLFLLILRIFIFQFSLFFFNINIAFEPFIGSWRSNWWNVAFFSFRRRLWWIPHWRYWLLSHRRLWFFQLIEIALFSNDHFVCWLLDIL